MSGAGAAQRKETFCNLHLLSELQTAKRLPDTAIVLGDYPPNCMEDNMVTPSSLTVIGKAITQLTADAPGVWSTNCGALFTDFAGTVPYDGESSVASVFFRAQNITSTGTVSVTGHADVPVSILGEYPGQPSYPYEWEPDKRGVITNVKRNGSINGRVLGDGALRRDYRLVCQNNRLAVYDEVEQFWADHYPERKFRYSNPQRNLSGTFQFNSRIKVTSQSLQRINFEVEIREVPA